MGAALQLPGYFGDNWDALEECLRDMSEDAGASQIVVVTDASQLLADADPRWLGTLISILEGADAYWREGPLAGRPLRLRTLLTEPESRLWLVEDRLRELGLEVPRSP